MPNKTVAAEAPVEERMAKCVAHLRTVADFHAKDARAFAQGYVRSMRESADAMERVLNGGSHLTNDR